VPDHLAAMVPRTRLDHDCLEDVTNRVLGVTIALRGAPRRFGSVMPIVVGVEYRGGNVRGRCVLILGGGRGGGVR